MTIPPGDALALARALVAADSRNPSLEPGAPGEGAAADVLAEALRAWGARVDLHDVLPNRPNVVARFGSGPRSVMLNGHLDVVGTAGMTHDPFDPVIRDGRLYGRGAADMKSGIAAMCAAAQRAVASGSTSEIIIAAVVDEEHESAGTRSLLARGIRADAAIVAEPTSLGIATACKGFVWIEITVHGRAAHGSRYDVGADAIFFAGAVLRELEALDAGDLSTRTHPLLGRASVHIGTIEGGSAWSVYPDRCVIRVERRTLPGEAAETVVDECRRACARAAEARPGMQTEVSMVFAQQPTEIAGDAPLVAALRAACQARSLKPEIRGATYWSDVALLNAAGIPSLCFGPGDIAQAHGAEEWVRIEEIERATDVLTEFLRRR